MYSLLRKHCLQHRLIMFRNVLVNSELGNINNRIIFHLFTTNNNINYISSTHAATSSSNSSSEQFIEQYDNNNNQQQQQQTIHTPACKLFDDEQEYNILQNPNQPANPRLVKVALIGCPNAGKSTLTNALLGKQLMPVSSKVHTTRNRAAGVITDHQTQIVLLDSPGIVSYMKKRKHNLPRQMSTDCTGVLEEADIVAVLVDVSNRGARKTLDFDVLRFLYEYKHKNSVLILNKTDVVGKGELLNVATLLCDGFLNGRKFRLVSDSREKDPLFGINTKTTAVKQSVNYSPTPVDVSAEEYLQVLGITKSQKSAKVNTKQQNNYTHTSDSDKPDRKTLQLITQQQQRVDTKERQRVERILRTRQGWPLFREVFMVSALTEDGIEKFKQYLLDEAKPGDWLYRSDVTTDMTPSEIVQQSIQEQILEYLPKEVPYTIKQSTEIWETNEQGELKILQNIHCLRDSHARMLIGERGSVVRRIADNVSMKLRNIFNCDVIIRLNVESPKNSNTN